MSDRSLDFDGAADVGESLASGVSFVRSLLTWTVLLSLGTAWVVFWSYVARLNFVRGDVVGAITTLVVFVGVFVGALLWWLSEQSERVDVESFDLSVG